MKIIDRFKVLFLMVLFLIILPLVDSYHPSLAENAEPSTVVFYVGWYDVGKAALEGLEGIKRIDKGFYNSKEINTVYYDASKITIEEMEDALKKSGTYRGTVK
jgi:hypothetical protein